MVSGHYSVLLQASVDALITDTSGIYVDGTFGRGGHSQSILARLNACGRLIGFDKDPQAIEVADRLAASDTLFESVHASFSSLEQTCQEKSVRLDGVLLDLGVSSPQLDRAERGFSFLRDGPLDMRMDNTQGISAAEWIATTKEKEMWRVFKQYGEEHFAGRIVRKIIEVRETAPIRTTLDLAKLIEGVVPKPAQKNKHPATRVFQAIRIQVNSELLDLEALLEQAMSVIKPGGRIVIISFHSLEDRIVKRFFNRFSQSQDFPMGVPVTEDMLKAPLKMIGKAIKADQDELSENIRSRSAIMRVAERTDVVLK